MEKTRKMAFCATKVEGQTYQELDARAREYGAQFFEVPIEQISVFVVEDARPATYSKHGEGEPERWSGRFRIGCEVEADDEHASDDDLDEPGPEE
jgi:hypothetical protein